ncbi:LnmK family bifunctional acyltransferase/decarboxylase [Actinoplanes missouriensis]|nr:LnmK family bifunctional acyltransferase/decarboxylase [Actinoplanes missouriensis]
MGNRPVPVGARRDVRRRVRITTSMCGGSAAIYAQFGDWTWAAVSELCGVDVYSARTPGGAPAYLSFYHYEVRGDETITPRGLTFGDVVDLTSQCFDLGSESVLTLHRVARAGTDPGGPLTAREYLEDPRPGCLYVLNLNRWITRDRPDSNENLLVSSPVGFAHQHLPRPPASWPVRAAARQARNQGGFVPDPVPGYVPAAPPFEFGYDLDPVRDFNGVGLVYFAAYFAIADTALAALWRSLGRTNRQFLHRRVLGQRIAYFGNADTDARLTITVRLLRHEKEAGDEIADIAIREAGTGRLLAVTAVDLREPE